MLQQQALALAFPSAHVQQTRLKQQQRQWLQQQQQRMMM
jgi:hypothetical protein